MEGVPVCDLLELLREELVHVLVGAPDVLGPRRYDALLKCCSVLYSYIISSITVIDKLLLI